MASKTNASTLELLPNELLLNICQHLTARELYRAFHPLNHRFRAVVDSMANLHLTMTEHECHEPPGLAFRRIIKLSIERMTNINLRQFSSVRSLKWISPSDIQLQQLCLSIYFPYLCQLSVYNMRDTSSTAHFHQFIFSNGFPFLRKCNLSHVNISTVWTLSPSLHAVNVSSVIDLRTFECILMACPNLNRLDLHIAHRIRTVSPFSFQHMNLKRLHLTGNVSLHTVDHILACVPVLIHLNFKWALREQPTMYFQHLSNTFNALLAYLYRFDCEFLCNGHYEDFMSIKPALERLHPCFTHRLRFTKLSYGRVRISTT